jgi:hypothetical protein
MNRETVNQSINPPIDLEAVKAKLITSSWSEETGPIEISDAEMSVLLRDAVDRRGINEDRAKFGVEMLLSGAPVELHSALRLAYAHALMVSPTQLYYERDVRRIYEEYLAIVRKGDAQAAAAYRRRLPVYAYRGDHPLC